MNLHPYQRQAASFLLANDRSALFMEMGLGKTATVLTAMQQRHVPMLVVAPKRVAENVWHTEAAKWRPGLRVALAVGSKAKREAALADTTAHVVVISRDNMADAIPQMGRFNSLVLDELSSFKNRATNRFKACKVLAADIPVCWGLTGTPVPNGMMDMWAQAFLIDGGARLGRTLTSYRNSYFFAANILPNGIVAKWALRTGAYEKIMDRLEGLAVSMRAADYLDLPPITFNHVAVPLPANAAKLYADMLNEFVATVDGSPITAANAAAKVGKLSQITAGFLYPQDELGERIPGAVVALHAAKVDALEEIIDGTGSPVLVFYQFKAELEMLKARFPQASTIDEPGVMDRWNAGDVPVLLAHPASAGHGLNLQSGPGHTIVWTTTTYSSEIWSQANARIARQGQAHPVIVHVLQAPDSVDGIMFDVVTGKVDLETAVMNHLKGAKC